MSFKSAVAVFLHSRFSRLNSPLLPNFSSLVFILNSFQVIIAYLSFFCSRLLDLREEIRAARCIQMAWRQHHLHTKMKGQLIEVNAANKLQVSLNELKRKS